MDNSYERDKLLKQKEEELKEINLKYKKLEEKYNILNSNCYQFKKENQLYVRFPTIKIYNYLRKVKRTLKANHIDTRLKKKIYKMKQTMKVRKNYLKLPTIDVVVPTYKKNEYLEDTINSILNQKYPKKKIRIIISVNGQDKAYYKYLKKNYKNNSHIEVIYTNKKGLGAARNNAKKYLKNEFVTYLDDDDWFTNTFLLDLVKNVNKDVTIMCGKMCNIDETEGDKQKYETNTYINKVISQFSNRYMKEYYKIGSLFSSYNAKLYRRDLIQNCFGAFNEEISNTEDVLFWVENINKVYGEIYIISENSEECYVRRVTKNSMSRPNAESEYNFYINQRLHLINLFAENLFKEDITEEYIYFVLSKIFSQTKMMQKYFDSLDDELKEKTRKLILASDNIFLNKSLFGKNEGIAFCHNFLPFSDTSAYVATRRLAEINGLANEQINWTVIAGIKAKGEEKDILYDQLFARLQYSKILFTNAKTYFNEKSQYLWGEEAFKLVNDKPVKYIYSRSMWAGSHVAAYKYKMKYPNVVWYAEFSDPISKAVDGTDREYARKYEGEESFLNTFWKDIEINIFKYADYIIFTNENQKEYMIQNSCPDSIVESTRKKAIVLHHPEINKKYCNIVKSRYHIDDNQVNIGYFGNFYKNRGSNELLKLAENPKNTIHIFTANADEIEQKKENIKINSFIPYFEFLNVASKMDYVFLNDVNFEEKINPYLPSKLADYLSTGTKILAKVNKNSPMSKIENLQIIKINNITDEFIYNLSKTKKAKNTKYIK